MLYVVVEIVSCAVLLGFVMCSFLACLVCSFFGKCCVQCLFCDMCSFFMSCHVQFLGGVMCSLLGCVVCSS